MSRTIPLVLASVLAAAPLAASADDVGVVRGRIQAAMHGARSMVVTTSASTGFDVAMTFVAPDRFHSVLAYGGVTRDVVLIGRTAYVSTAGGPYEAAEPPAEVLAMEAQLLDIPVDRLLPDITAGGKTWGSFVTTSTGPKKDQRLYCTYDRATYRIGVCKNEGFTMSFSRYDDPANVVNVPAKGSAPAAGAHS
jgi:hypothetical protein